MVLYHTASCFLLTRPAQRQRAGHSLRPRAEGGAKKKHTQRIKPYTQRIFYFAKNLKIPTFQPQGRVS